MNKNDQNDHSSNYDRNGVSENKAFPCYWYRLSGFLVQLGIPGYLKYS